MVYLLFQIGADRYAMEAVTLKAVLPCLQLKRIPQAARGIAGVFNYRGTPVPVIDLSDMALGVPAEASLSTRLVLIRYRREGAPDRLLGLLAEKAINTARYNEDDFQDPGIATPQAPYLGPVIHDAQGIVQRLELERLLTPEVRDTLWQQAVEAL